MAEHSTFGSTGMPSWIVEEDVEDIQLVIEVTTSPCSLSSSEVDARHNTIEQGDIRQESAFISQERINEGCHKPTGYLTSEFQHQSTVRAPSVNGDGTYEEAVRSVQCGKRKRVDSHESRNISDGHADQGQRERRTVVLPGMEVPRRVQTGDSGHEDNETDTFENIRLRASRESVPTTESGICPEKSKQSSETRREDPLHEARCVPFVDLREKLNSRRKINAQIRCLQRCAEAEREESSGEISNQVAFNQDSRDSSPTNPSTSLLSLGLSEQSSIRASSDLHRRESNTAAFGVAHASKKRKMGCKEEDDIPVSTASSHKEHSYASTTFDRKESGSIGAPTNFSQHAIRYNEGGEQSGRASGGKRTPFVSEDPEENWDNYNPGWESFRRLSTDQARYEAVHRLWRNRRIPNPHANFSHYFHHSRQDPTRTSRKRKASTQPSSDDSSSSSRPAKRARLDTYVYDQKLEELENRKSQECCAARQQLQDRIERLRSEFQTTGEDRSSRRHFRSFTVPWDMRYWQKQQREQQLQQQYENRTTQIANRYAARMNRLRSARQEVQHFNMFYVGLVDANPRMLSAVQMEEQLMIEKLLGLFKSAYKASFPVQFAEDVPHIDSRSLAS
ncbi:uncharacterized protein LOC135387624 [Ornithodoros turicata]|uniref:uncharacterized protein LOC135387624 n=1 Tax=Ornithodoros turicata TaxID=34597 RepID=UPI0031390440